MFIQSLDLYDILSFRRSTLVELSGLNILIGPNGVGKSNLIECLALLRSLPNNISSYLSQSGGVNEWIFKGHRDRNKGCAVACVLEVAEQIVYYKLSFLSENNSLIIASESLAPSASSIPYFERTGKKVYIRSKFSQEPEGRATIGVNDSVFAIYRNPFETTPITKTAQALNSIRIYREFNTGTAWTEGARRGVPLTAPKHPLNYDGANLALVLQEMASHGSLKKVEGYLKQLLNRFENIEVRHVAGFAQTYILEHGAGAMSLPV